MKIIFVIVIFAGMLSCSENKYDISNYYDRAQQDSVLTEIITHLTSAPLYTTLAKRFEPEHRYFYASMIPQFKIFRYHIADDGTNYFYVLRPGPKGTEMRAVGGHFKMSKHLKPVNFREVFVTPLLPEEDLKNRVAFLFDEMVKGNIKPYLKMKSYVQWPNRASVYDSVLYQWKLNKDSIN